MKEDKLRALLLRMEADEPSAFTELYHETKEDVYRMVRLLVSNPGDAVEVVHEVYVALWKSYHKYDSERSFRYWLHGLVIRQVSSYRRTAWRRFRLFEKQKQYVEPAMYEEDGLLFERRQVMLKQVQTLPPKLREVIVLRYYSCLTGIAALLSVPVGTVKSRHHTALKRLRVHFMEEDVNGKRLEENEYESVHRARV
ncbi:hypothetical protein SY83_19025 [Paenibacillus swuensis]|uniref:RNA polymerase sigma factor n=1 Tax=Paenibacillus swuensis TaxID=1178515 RepID=A0A172TLU2_9BACL|nr:sigma-70 family RNA polymerase sigma factor [Paenibacillus swuensis]ANE48039.1 hypothetical protein SY83_19025 [Paenibacillus swuensis]